MLQHDFAVILLDVNMPGMDGFETAALIRERPSCRDTPIIFITAYSDDAHAARGYSLGAVDYILTPVHPEVLRTKVSVFVELFRKTDEVRRQRETLRRSGAAPAAQPGVVGDQFGGLDQPRARDGGRTRRRDHRRPPGGDHRGAATRYGCGHVYLGRGRTGAIADRARARRLESRRDGRIAAHAARRLTASEADAHPPWGEPVELIGGRPMRGWLAAPLTAHDGRLFGVVQLSEKSEGEFSEDDEGILVQLAQMAAIAIENTLARRSARGQSAEG